MNNPLFNAWRRVSPSLVPILAVITALIITIPFMVVTRGQGDIGKGLNVAGTAYTSLLEGSIGLAINPVLKSDDVAAVLDFVEGEAARGNPVNFSQLRLLAQRSENLVLVGPENIRFYNTIVEQYYETDALPDERAFNTLGDHISEIILIGDERLRRIGNFFIQMQDLDNREAFIQTYSILTDMDMDTRAAIEALIPHAATLDDDDLLTALNLLAQRPYTRLRRAYEQLQLLDELGLTIDDEATEAIRTIFELEDDTGNDIGPVQIRQIAEVEQRLRDAGVQDIAELASQLRLVTNLYSEGILTNNDVATAIQQELPVALDQYLIIRRPLNQILIHRSTDSTISTADNTFGTIRSNRVVVRDVSRDEYQTLIAEGHAPQSLADQFNPTVVRGATFMEDGESVTRDVTREEFDALQDEAAIAALQDLFNPSVIEDVSLTYQVPSTVYFHAGNRVVLFFPAALEETLRRAIPFIIAGLAVALGFKAGLFNIGAEGQLYIGATLAAWVGFSSIFEGLPIALHLPLVLIAGFIGGAIWGMIPGILKAYTGAHEVINTIMMNFIAIRLVDWLIKSTDPVVLRDTSRSFPRTDDLAPSASLPRFDTLFTSDTLTISIFAAAGFLVALYGVWSQWERIQNNLKNIIRPIIYGVLVFLGGVFVNWTSVAGNLHYGLVLMILTIFLVDWFLERTIYGFELRTVGANPNAAQYAGMSVKWNVVLAMTLSGALAGLAGIIQISGVQGHMEPEFFAGLGFDAIAVALLARNNPRNMIWAGLLWGGLLTGNRLMQVNADIANDLVKIIQALIIMFIAADGIIRMVWRVPEATAEEKASAKISTGWGG